MDFIAILAAGVASGTILAIAAIGAIFAERSGVLNLGVEGMMLVGAVAAFSIAVSTGSPWLGVLVAMLAAGLLSQLHAVMTIHFRADQVVSGLALTFLGTGLARVLGEGLSSARDVTLVGRTTIPLLADVPIIGPIFFTDQSTLTYAAYLLVPIASIWIARTRPGLHLRAVGESPAAADAMGINVVRYRYAHTLVGGAFAGVGGACFSISILNQWVDGLTNGAGWIAIALVIFSFWRPHLCLVGAYLFGAFQALPLTLQAREVTVLPTEVYESLPYVMTIVVLVLVSTAGAKRRLGAPAALGLPYVREER